MQSVQQNWNAEDYAKHSSAQLQWAQALIPRLALQGHESVLDIGCGDEKISAQLALAAPQGQVVGIDLSEDMIRLATAQFPPDQYPNLCFRQMDATAIRMSEQFDVAFSTAALHWVKDQLAVLRGLRASLKTGGKVLLQMGGSGNADDVIRTIDGVTGASQWQPYFQGFTPPYCFHGPEEYARWLSESGFRAVRVGIIPKDMQHQGVAGLLGWLRTTWFPYTDRLPVGLRNAFLAEVPASYTAEHPVDALGNTHVRMVRLEVEAQAI